jgi:3-oxoacyl-[acyl-carrier protein] reductase
LALRLRAASHKTALLSRSAYNSSEEKAHALADSIKTNGGTSLATKANNSDPEAIKAAVAQTVGRFGRIDI